MSTYDNVVNYQNSIYNYQMNGKIFVQAEDREWEITKQGKLKYYLEPNTLKDNALRGWMVFVQHLVKHSGAHTHQGGVVIFVLDGEGYTILEGQRWDWKKGDLIIFPIQPGGVEHQHFNNDPDKPCRWIAYSFFPFREACIAEFTQGSISPMYTEENKSE